MEFPLIRVVTKKHNIYKHRYIDVCMTLEQQLKDWRELKTMCTSVIKVRGEEVRKQTRQRLYEGVRRYNKNYKMKFDYSKPPK